MGQTFRLMTANLLHDSCDVARFDALLGRVSPDVVVTQELGPDCAEVLAELYPYHHLRPAHDFTGRGIASRLKSEFGEISMPARNGTWAMVDLRGRLMRLVGMHLVNPVEFPWWKSLSIRRRQLAALFAWTDVGDDDIPLVVAGDMNATPTWPAYRDMASRWDDLAVQAASAGATRPEPTWGWRPGWPRTLRIDHVFALGARATGYSVEPIEGSDHHAVVVDIEVP